MWTPRVVALAALVVGLALAPPAETKPAPPWAAAATASIHPGTQIYTAGAQCTANVVFRDRAGRVYVGYAAHCAGTGEATDTDGCRAASLPLGTPVTFNEGGNPTDEGTRIATGRLAYSSWLTMQRLGETDPLACAYNDLALVRVRTRDVAKVNPSVPFWGGPTGIDTDGTAAGDRVWTYGNSSLRFGITALSPHTGISLGDDAADGGWSHPLYTVTPGVPGDSGSAFLSADGTAIGVLSTLGLAPLPASNNIGDLAHELGYAQQHSGLRGLRLVKGTEPFQAPL
ncbi:hypothetical protein GON03_18040 [Nocardioides sp. MAH-18]|uniref:Serine protease n=1 Tax=Nocardioides agri TaxID=2682843 RepID=A0A6L6XVI5_9ACTN|nr:MULTISPECIES: hypothetical protein [unclassified Nocardioides]MBA2956245.1 hypothetical protein [Nocardioides sp. CGMCC 1.13656]MVQ51088.1 hypothetical protein [Nocardioides sp. MAH-18]